MAMTNTTGYASITDAAPAVEPELLHLMSRIQDATARLAHLHELGKLTANRIFGAQPEAGLASVKGPASDGMMSMLHLAVDDLHGRITDCTDGIERLAKL